MKGLEERLYIQWILYTKDGEIKRKSRVYRGRSYLIAHAQHLLCSLSNTNISSVLDTGNTSRTLLRPAVGGNSWWQGTAGVGTGTSGIQIGTGNTTVTITDFSLAALIAHGTSSGQMEYGSSANFSAILGSGSERHFTNTRTFTNNSGGNITVAEVGLAVITDDSGSANRNFLVARDVLGSTVLVADTEALAVVYTIKVVL